MLIPEMRVDVGAVNGGVAAGTEAGSFGEQLRAAEPGVGHLADHDGAGLAGDLGVAFEAEVVVAFGEEFGIDGAVRFVAGGATFAHGRVGEDEGLGLFAVAFGAEIVGAGDRHTGRMAGVAVGIVTIEAGHFAFEHGMPEVEVELGFFVEVAGHAGFGGFAGVDDEFSFAAAGFDVEAAGAVAGFAALTFDALAFAGDFEAGMGGVLEVLHDFLVAGTAGVNADIGGAGDHGRRRDDAFDGGARDGEADDGKGTDDGDKGWCFESGYFQWSPRLV